MTDIEAAVAKAREAVLDDIVCVCDEDPCVTQAHLDHYGKLKAAVALTCVCGHLWQLHDGHTVQRDSLPVSPCSQGDGCRVFTPSAAVLAELARLIPERAVGRGGAE